MPSLINSIEANWMAEDARPRRSHNVSRASCLFAPNEGGEPELTGNCLRSEAFAWWGWPATDPARFSGRIKMETGYALEDRLMDQAQKVNPIIRQYDCRWRPDGFQYDIHGKLDGLMWNRDAGYFENVTVKCPGSFKVKQQKAYGPNSGYRLQVMVECAVLLRETPDLPLQAIRHLTISRSDGYPDEVVYPLDRARCDAVLDACVARWRALEVMVPERILPRPEYRDLGSKGPWSHWRCKFCDWHSLCQSYEEGNDQALAQGGKP
jgi:hypothetical protein